MNPKYLTFSATVLAVALLCAACKSKTEVSTSSGSNTDSLHLAPGAPATPAGDSSAALHTADTASPVVTNTAVISTSKGDIAIDLYGKDAPKAVQNFVGLSKKGYYKGIAFHRVIPNFMIQTGDPLSKDTTKWASWGEGGESIFGGTFADELDPNTPSGRRGYDSGVVAMANAGPNTNGSQFFIVLTKQGAAHLPFAYTVFGHVTRGMDVVHKIEQTGQQGEKPLHPERITDIKVKEAGK